MLKQVVMLCFAAGSLGLNVAADDAVPTDDDKEKRYEVRVERVVTSEKSDDDEDVKATVSGKIVIMGPDGKVKEYALNDELPEGVKVLVHGDGEDIKNEEKNVFVIQSDDAEAQERLMIGVHCDVADEVLRSHLKLGDSGLVVLEVIDESPALSAGMKKGDVLFRANGSGLEGVEALVDVVQDSDGGEIEFGVIRAGDRMEISVKPKMMAMNQHVVLDHMADLDIELDSAEGALRWVEKLEELELPEEALKALKGRRAGVRVRKLQPGIVIDRALNQAQLEELIEDVRERALSETARVKEAHEAEHEVHLHLKELHEHAHEAHEKAIAKAKVHLQQLEHADQTIESVEAQMKQLQKQMEVLKKTLEKLSNEKKD